MLHGFRFRLPLWAAVALVAAVYLARSALRGFDFRPDLPADTVVIVMFAIVLGIVAYVRATASEEARSPDGENEPSGDADR